MSEKDDRGNPGIWETIRAYNQRLFLLELMLAPELRDNVPFLGPYKSEEPQNLTLAELRGYRTLHKSSTNISSY